MGKAGEMKNKTTSIRNLIPRRAYKERGQLEDRKHLGIILEKHKDYKRRSQNFKQKDKVIKKLSLKAQLRNPDEFYHKMNSARYQDGTHQVILKGNQQKARKLMEQKDISLVQMNRIVEARKAEKMQANLHLIDMPKENQHIKFISDLNEIQTQAIPDEPVKSNPRLEKIIMDLQSENKQQYKRLADAVQKSEQYSKVQEALELDKHLKGKGKKRQVQMGERTMYKWFSERKR